jgi:hypothetical protein
VKPQNALSAGDQFVLLVPADLTHFRYNIGVRTLGTGASITVTRMTAISANAATLLRRGAMKSLEQSRRS